MFGWIQTPTAVIAQPHLISIYTSKICTSSPPLIRSPNSILMASYYPYYAAPKKDCTFEDSTIWFEQHGPSGPTILLTMLMFTFTAALEVLTHVDISFQSDFLCLNRSGKFNDAPPAYDTSGTPDDEPDAKTADAPSLPPSRLARAYRYTFASLLFVVVFVLFVLRIVRLRYLHMFPDCTYHKEYYVRPIWVGIFFLNILPLIVAFTAWLRAAVDFHIGLRCGGRTVPYPTRHYPFREGRIGWPPCLPLYVVYLAFAYPIAWMGVVKLEDGGKDAELGSEERERLVGAGGGEDVQGEAPPPYEELCHACGRGGHELQETS
ncbi:hypothetical protein N0V90_009654 [Kalmusia sp. IMI 367209]|nr:hypothetical protein N0V90_009654 [Kalmusia sp. IMI 367209]